MEHRAHIMGEDALPTIVNNDKTEELLVLPDTSILSEANAIDTEEVVTLSPLELLVAEEKLNNVAPQDIARRLGVSNKVVRIVLARSNVRKYVREVFESVTSNSKEVRMQLMAQMIENKMEEDGVTSGLDLAQLVSMLDSMGKVKEQADVGSQNNVMINILNQISKGE